MRQTLGQFSRIVWALDPFERPEETTLNVARTLAGVAKGRDVRIEPVYVLNPDGLGVPSDLSDHWLESFSPAAEKAMAAALKEVPIPGLMKPRILLQNGFSLRQSVQTLLEYAKGQEADLIVAGTHARKGISRLVLGSFTETLLLQSEIPVLTANPRMEVRPLEHILHPTSFGPRAKKTFDAVLGLAKSCGAKLTLLHVAPHPIEPVLRSGVFLLGGGQLPISEYMTEQESKRRKTAEEWAAEAKAAGIEIEVKFSGGEEGIKNGILKEAASDASGLIAMAAESGPVASALAGSITRQVVRDSPCAVWVLRT